MMLVVACSEVENVANNHCIDDGRIVFSATVSTDGGDVMRSVRAKSNALASIGAKTEDGKTIYLHAVTTPIPVDSIGRFMRGAKIESVDDIPDFGVTAFKTSGTFASEGASVSNCYFDTGSENKIIQSKSTKPASGTDWSTSTPYNWPAGTDKLSFFAYSPYSNTTPFDVSAGSVTLIYTADAAIADQKDMLVASAFDENHATSLDPRQSLVFKHALTAVTFTAAADLFPCTVTKVSLSGIPTTNTYTYSTSSTGTWATSASNPQDFSIPVNQAVDGPSTGVATTLTSGTNTLLMVPQTLPSDAKVTIEFKDAAGRDHKLCYSLAGQVWEAGKQVNYTLSSSSLTSIQIEFADAYAQQSGSAAQDLPSGLKTQFTKDEEIGLYVVDIANKKILVSNKKITVPVDGSSVTVTSLDGALDDEAFLSTDLGKYHYFAYYPYQSSPSVKTESALTSTETAATFLEGLISGWSSIADNQVSIDDINSGDLQAGDGSVSGTSLTIKLCHQMGLAAVKMGKTSGTPIETETLDGNTAAHKYYSTTSTQYYGIGKFDGNQPYRVGSSDTDGSSVYYYLVNPSIAKDLKSSYKLLHNGTVDESGSNNTQFTRGRQWKTITLAGADAAETNTNMTCKIERGKYRVITTSAPLFKNLARLYSYSTTIPQTFEPAYSGLYQFQCWGGCGGRSLDQGKMGANLHSVGGYVTGDMTLTEAERTFYLAVGEQGGDAIIRGIAVGGWPGGGKGYSDCNDDESGGGGGGCSAIYLEAFTKDNATNFDKLKTRIMVAGAGGGSTYSTLYTGGFLGAGGGLSGLASTSAKAGTQDSGYQFGVGQNAKSTGPGNYGTGGGGAGYWGGYALQTETSYSNGGTGAYNGGGGSSFVSGLTGCKAITATSTSSSISYRTGTDATIHYSGLYFTNASTIAGNASMPNPAAATGNVTGSQGNGYIRITFKPYGN